MGSISRGGNFTDDSTTYKPFLRAFVTDRLGLLWEHLFVDYNRASVEHSVDYETGNTGATAHRCDDGQHHWASYFLGLFPAC